jgi:outer membrane protein
MKRKFKIILIGLLTIPWGVMTGQESGGEMVLSLQQAQDYAIQHNKMAISARLDVEASRMALWQTISSGLPQISSSAGLTDNIKQMTFLIPNFLTPDPDDKTPITMGTQYNASVAIQATMPLFSAPYLIGIETSKLAMKLAETNVSNTELDIRESVTSLYYLILISEESLKILDGNLANLRETLKSTQTMFNVGMAESTDVDQMVSNVNMVENSRSSMERTIELNYNMLRFQLGVPSDTRIILTGTLEDFTREINVEALLSQEFNYTDNLTYKLAEGQEQISSLGLKTQKALVLPTLSGVVSGTKTGMGDKVNDINWYNSSLVALQLSLPIITSGQRYAAIKKAKFNLEKAKNTKEMVTDQLKIQEKQLRYNLVNANLQYKNQKENVEVSRRVYESMENKFRQGMASSLELTQANSQFLQSENNYISALMNLLQTKLALDKLLCNI